ncbi:MAG: 4-(cytidine 5'-diphospho)-2-C-methyl-D-erythritol kinase [Bacteroidia bacterium]|nr:4-(cytidine 5'-diphospho)-2-C-methyl-D-erythritol kinase [Bacteroidia bacterium]
MLKLNSPAKINLGLIVKGRRPDGYHEVETLLYPVKLADEMTFSEQEGNGISVVMEGISMQVNQEDNLIWKAAQALKRKVGKLPGLEIRVVKNIPAGAGLGGGSSNAATTLQGLNEMLGLGLKREELVELARPLGADVPFFLYNEPMLATGIGQNLEPFELEIPYDIGLITPGIHSSTPDAYRGLFLEELDPKRSLKEALRAPFEEWPDRVVNDLEEPVFADYPLLSRLKNDLYVQGAIYAAMTGSGSGIYAFFHKK